MKIAYCSDLHLDFEYPDFSVFKSDADYLFILGDTIESKWLEFAMNPNSGNHGQAQKLVELFQQLNQDYKKVLIVAGNHEHYFGNLVETPELFNDFIKIFKLHNVEYLEDSVTQLEGRTVYGATMWTDMGHPQSHWFLKQGMNDFRLIRSKGYRKLSPAEAARIHAHCIKRILEVRPDIVLMHHAPSAMSVHPKYVGDALNSAYYSEVFDKLLREGTIDWPLHIFHGHVHNEFEYSLGTAQVHCNPRGYSKENPNWELKCLTL